MLEEIRTQPSLSSQPMTDRTEKETMRGPSVSTIPRGSPLPSLDTGVTEVAPGHCIGKAEQTGRRVEC